MKAYKLNIKEIMGVAGFLTLIIYSIVLHSEGIAQFETLGEIMLHFGLIILPIYLLWEFTNHYLWHTRLLQSIRKSLNISPDLRGRWEGVLENADGSPPQKFVIEIKQTLTKLLVHSFSSIGHSTSILAEIASDESEDNFVLCYLWQGESNTSIKDSHQGEKYQGYTMLYLNEKESQKTLKGSYFTNRKPLQTRGGIELNWISYEMKRRIE